MITFHSDKWGNSSGRHKNFKWVVPNNGASKYMKQNRTRGEINKSIIIAVGYNIVFQ